MHLLLPPSETKTRGGRGQSLRRRLGTTRPGDATVDAPPGDGPLDAARARTLAALARLTAGPAQDAAEALLLPVGVAAQALADNAAVLDAPTVPALRRYSGTVYDGLDFASFTAAEQRLAARSVLIFSGLFGLVRGGEPIPAYRVPAKAVLPGIGVVATFWRPVLDEVAPDQLRRRGLIVDLRSGDYAAMWRPAAQLADRMLTIRVLSPLPRGGHGIISYASKLGKGRLAAALVRRAANGLPVGGAEDIAAAWLSCGGIDCVAAPGRLELYTADAAHG